MFNDGEWYDGTVTTKQGGTISATVRVDQPGGVLYSTSHGMTLMAPWSDVVEVQINLSPRLKTVNNQDAHGSA